MRPSVSGENCVSRPSTKIPKPTTNSPVTAPPHVATCMAAPKPLRAASAVRTLALTATFMPIKPAALDAIAPTKK